MRVFDLERKLKLVPQDKLELIERLTEAQDRIRQLESYAFAKKEARTLQIKMHTHEKELAEKDMFIDELRKELDKERKKTARAEDAIGKIRDVNMKIVRTLMEAKSKLAEFEWIIEQLAGNEKLRPMIGETLAKASNIKFYEVQLHQ
jgi:chromosome segregation ATPase